MTLLHFNGNILQMGVVEMGWGSGALLGGLVLACKALKSKQTLVMHTAYVILGLYLISASYLPSSAFIGFVCLTFTGGIAIPFTMRFSSLLFSRTWLRTCLDGLFLSSLV